MGFLCVWSAWAATDPGDRFLQAYFLIQDADRASKDNERAKAGAKFLEAQKILREIKAATPDWNSHIIDFRLKYCDEQLAILQPKLPATATPTPVATEPVPAAVVTTVVVQAAAPAGPRPEDQDRINQLTSELEQAHKQITDLESRRGELQGKLQEALKQVPATETNVKIEELVAANKKLSEQLATAQQRIEDLGDQADRLQKAQEKIKELEATRDTLTTQLQESQAKITATQAAGDARAADLEKQNKELAAKLAEAQKDLETVRSGAVAAIESAEIKKLRAQLAAAVTEMERTQQELVTSYQEIGTMKQELASARAENANLKQSYEGALTKLKDAETRISALEMAGSKDDEVILYLRKENALLKQIVERRETASTNPASRRGFSFFRRKPVEPAPAALVVKESETGKLVAELSANPAPVEQSLPPQPASPLKPNVAKADAPPRAEVPAALESKSAEVRALVNDGRKAAEAKDYAGAAKKFEAALDIEPNNLIALSNLGVVNYQQNKLDESEQFLRRAVALAPNDAESRALLGIVYFRKGKTDDAFAELTRAIAINPRHAEAHNYLGITLSEKGWSAAAEQEIRKAIELNPQYADAHFNLAVLYANLRTPRYELAKYHYQKSLDLGAQPDTKLAELLQKAGSK